jgi:predicted anti-sigma-YlaC factor YlaD
VRSACEEILARLPEACRGERSWRDLDAHVASCLPCRLELARYERLFRLLRQLAGDRAEPPPNVLAELTAALEAAAARSAARTLLTGRRIACAGACVGAALTGVLVLLRGRADKALRPAADC